MASLRQVLVALQQQATLATTGLSMFNSPIQVSVGVGWPPTRTLQYLTKMSPPGAIVAVFDRRSGKDSTRWVPDVIASTVTQTGLVSTPQQQILAPLGTCHITLSGTLVVADAVSMVLQTYGPWAATDPGDGSYTAAPLASGVVAAGVSDTLTTMATALATVPATALPAGLVTATSSGPVVTLTSLLRSAIVVSSYTGNVGTITMELGRRHRELLLSVWAPSTEIRDAVSAPLEVMISQMEAFLGSTGQYVSGLMLSDGTSARVMASNDYQLDDPVLTDLYRHDYCLTVDYPITTIDTVYTVLAPNLQMQITA